jgi:hypothetical protein
MSGPEDEVSQAEKRRIIREQAGTFFSHAQTQAGELSGGRFAATGTPHVTGATPVPNYPAAAAHQRDPVPIEPPLGIDINAMPEQNPTGDASSGVLPPVDTGGAEAPSDPGLSEHAAPPPLPEGSGDDAA